MSGTYVFIHHHPRGALAEAVVSHLEGEDAGAGAHQVAPEAAEEAAEPVVVLRNVDNPVVVP